MRWLYFAIFIILFISLSKFCGAQIIVTVAGNGVWGSTGDGGLATDAAIYLPNMVATDLSGNFYFGDRCRLRKVIKSGFINYIAGASYTACSCGADNMPATTSSLQGGFEDAAIDKKGCIFFTDGYKIKKIDTAGIITTIAGSCTSGYSGDGVPATDAQFSQPQAIAFDKTGNLFIADYADDCIRKIDTNGIITLFAGIPDSTYSGSLSAGDGGPATLALFSDPCGLAIDSNNNIYIAEQLGPVRKINAAGIITTVAGYIGWPYFSGDGGPATDAGLGAYDIALDKMGNLYICDADNYRIRKVDTSGIITTYAGNGILGFGGDGGPITACEFYPTGIAIDTFGNIFIADYGNFRIRKIIQDQQPIFTGGTSRDINTCIAAGGIRLDSLLTVFDPDTGQREIWSLVDTPSHGTVNILDTARSTGDTLHLSGVFYTPDSGFSGTDYFKVKIADSLGGYQVMTVHVTIYTPAEAGSITGRSVVCTGDTVFFIDSSFSGWGAIRWSVSNSRLFLLGSSVIGRETGVDTLYFTLANVCDTVTASKVLSINTIPVTPAITGTDSVCPGSSITLSLTAGSGGAWSCSNSDATVSSVGIVTGVSAGMDTAFYAITNICGTVRASFPITINPLPVSGIIIGSDSICTGGHVSLTETASGIWHISNPAASITTTGVVTGMSAGIDTVFHTATTSCGTDTATLPITILQLANTGAISGRDSVCMGSEITVLDTIPHGFWSCSNNKATIDSTGKILAFYAGWDTVFYAVTNYCGTDSATRAIFIKSIPSAGTATAPSGDTSCIAAGYIPVIDSTSGGIWSSDSGISISLTETGVKIQGNRYGWDTVFYIVSNECGSDSAWLPIFTDTFPKPFTIIGADSLCIGSSATLSTSDSLSGGIWESSDSGIMVSGGVIAGITPGTDTVYYTYANPCGSYTASHALYIIAPLSKPILSGISVICAGRWQDTLTTTITGGNWASLNTNATVASGIVTALNSGTDTIIYSLSNLCGSVSDSMMVSIPTAWECDSITSVRSTSHNAQTQPIIFPNPNSGQFTIQFPNSGEYKLQMMDIKGNAVPIFYESINTTGSQSITTSLPAGMYVIRILSSAQTWMLKVIIE